MAMKGKFAGGEGSLSNATVTSFAKSGTRRDGRLIS